MCIKQPRIVLGYQGWGTPPQQSGYAPQGKCQ